MKKTPDSVSRERQRVGRETAGWESKIKEARASLQITPASRVQAQQQSIYYQEQLKECRKRMAVLRHKGRQMWTFKSR